MGATGAIERWMPFGRVFEPWPGPAARRHGPPTRSTAMATRTCLRRADQHPKRQMFGVRGARATHQPRHQLLGGQSLRAGVRRVRRRRSGIGWDRWIPAIRIPFRQRVSRVTNLGVSTSTARPTRCGQCHCIRVSRPGRSPRTRGFEVHDLDSAETTRLPPATSRSCPGVMDRGARDEK